MRRARQDGGLLAIIIVMMILALLFTPANSVTLTADANATRGSLPSLNQRLWYEPVLTREQSPIRPVCDEPGSDLAITPGMRLTFHYASRTGPANKEDPTKGLNRQPWGIAAYSWIVPTELSSRDDFFVFDFLLDSAVSEDWNLGDAPIDLVGEYLLAGRAVHYKTNFESSLASALFPVSSRCLRLHYQHAAYWQGQHSPPNPAAIPRDCETGTPAVPRNPHLAAATTALISQGEYFDLCNPRASGTSDDNGSPPFSALRFDVSMPRPTPHIRKLTVLDFSNFFFTDDQVTRGRYQSNASYKTGHDVGDGRGYASAEIPLRLSTDVSGAAPRYVPVDATAGWLESTYHVRIRGIRRVCAFFSTLSGDCTKITPDQEKALGKTPEGKIENALTDRADRRVTIWFESLLARDAIALAPGHPNDYVLADKIDKAQLLLAPFDYLYVDGTPPFSDLHAIPIVTPVPLPAPAPSSH